jgi:hypothetical protein
VELLSGYEKIIAGRCSNLRTDLVVLVFTPLNEYDTVAACDLKELCAVSGDEDLVARCSQLFKLPHKAPLRVRVQIQLRFLDAENCVASERFGESLK